MDGGPAHPLTPDEAKARLREVARQASLRQWIGDHPLSTLTAALLGGFLAGRMGTAALARTLLVRRLGPLLLTTLLSRRRRS